MPGRKVAVEIEAAGPSERAAAQPRYQLALGGAPAYAVRQVLLDFSQR